MDAKTNRAGSTVAIFVDLENAGITGRSSNNRRRAQWMLEGLRITLPRFDLRMGPVWAAVQVLVGKSVPVLEYRRELTQIFARYNGEINWGSEIADNQLIKEVERQLALSKLPDVVLFISCDGDFAELLAKVRTSGRYVIVASPIPQVSKHLVANSDLTIKLSDFIGSNAPRPIRHGPAYR